MPLNNGRECFGITAAVEALWQARLSSGDVAGAPDLAAVRVFDNLLWGRRLTLPQKLLVGGRVVGIQSPEALAALSEAVTREYRRLWDRSNADRVSRWRWLEAESNSLVAVRQLDRDLASDPDGIAGYCGFGEREFDDGAIEESYHCFLLERGEQGRIVVYDSNAPAGPIECKLSKVRGRLIVSWRCAYRETGQTTTQRYQVVPLRTYMRVLMPPAKSA